MATPSSAKQEVDEAIAIGAVLLGAAALAASSHDHQAEQHKAHSPKRSVAPFSPAGHVTCYPARQICFRDNGHKAGKWTRRIYGR